jgi:hypothetical protein
MPCSDSSSSMTIFLDSDERFVRFEYAKITCGSEISGKTGLNVYFKDKPLSDIVETSFDQIIRDLNIQEEENQYILYMEWDALRSAVGQYLGLHNENIDIDRSRIISIDHTEQGTEVALIILPPKELPKILPCSLGDKNKNKIA